MSKLIIKYSNYSSIFWESYIHVGRARHYVMKNHYTSMNSVCNGRPGARAQCGRAGLILVFTGSGGGLSQPRAPDIFYVWKVCFCGLLLLSRTLKLGCAVGDPESRGFWGTALRGSRAQGRGRGIKVAFLRGRSRGRDELNFLLVIFSA